MGSALIAWYQHLGNERHADGENDFMNGAYLGPEFSNGDVEEYLNKKGYSYQKLKDEELPEKIADLVAEQNVIGWFQGRMEFGPRALGGRTIIGDSRSSETQKTINLKIKYRESFRPFAPSILEEDVSEQFEMQTKSPYMLLVANVKKELCKKMTIDEDKLFGIEKLNISRSSIPAITHINYTARVQTVSEKTNPRYYKLINAFKQQTGCPTIVNTSFNVRGEPIVCSPQDAFRCFMRTEMDILVLQNQLLLKKEQTNADKDETWKQEFELD